MSTGTNHRTQPFDRTEPLDRTEPVDLVVVGAGVIGLAHAAEALRRGLRVAVVERDDHAVGASVRNFGHICTTPQDGVALDYALAARARWLELGRAAGFDVRESGTLVVARSEDERAVLEDFADRRGSDQVLLLDRSGVGRHLASHDDSVVGGALLPLDLRLDSPTAVAALAGWLETQGVRFHWRTNALGFEPGVLRTSRGELRADRVVLALGHDVDRLLPDLADSVDLQRCALQMLDVEAPDGLRVEPAVLSGLSMLRYAGLSQAPAAADVRARIRAAAPDLLDVEMNLMFTQRPDGVVTVGDTHHDAVTHDPFDDERTSRLVLDQAAALLGVPGLTVRRRWRGVYARSASTDFLVDKAADGVHVVSVTSGIGMTTSHGLAAAHLDQIL